MTEDLGHFMPSTLKFAVSRYPKATYWSYSSEYKLAPSKSPFEFVLTKLPMTHWGGSTRLTVTPSESSWIVNDPKVYERHGD